MSGSAGGGSTEAASQGLPTRKACVACREAIHPEATRCPHCGSDQRPQRWRALATAGRWIGGTTAVVSLLLGVSELRELALSWRAQQQSLEELVRSVELQSATRSREGVIETIHEAIDSRRAPAEIQDLELDAAMTRLREARTLGDETFHDLVEGLIPVLRRAAGRVEGVQHADLVAHFGWANFLRWREGRRGIEVAEHYERALEEDPSNVYAHTMLAHWALWPGTAVPDRVELAKRHFASALAAGREREWVRTMQVSAWDNLASDAYKQELLRAANHMRESGDALPARDRSRVLRIYTGMRSDATWQRLLPALAPEQHVETLLWLDADRSTSLTRSTWTLGVLARLLVEADDPALARRALAALAPGLEEGADAPLREALQQIAG